jgi:hypothetical protein
MSRNSNQFDHEAFLHAFEGHEEILEEYLHSIPSAGVTVPRPVTSSVAFSSHLGLCPHEEYRVLTSGMVEAWEMASQDGHDQILAALRAAGLCAPYHLGLTSECLALHVLSTRRDLFETALSLDEVRKCDALQMFKPSRPVAMLGDLNAATNAFRALIAASCGTRFGSRRILLRRFEDTEMFTIGFYFEKSPRAHRRLSGTESSPNLEREEARDLQFDAALFEPATGMLGIRSGYGRLTNPIRRAFAESFLGDPDAYEWPGADKVLQLFELFAEDQEVPDALEYRTLITEVDYSPAHDEMMARFRITGADILEILRRDQRLETVRSAFVRRVTLKMPVEGITRRRKVVLTAPNKIEFKRGADAPQIITKLYNSDVLLLPRFDSVPT